MNQNAEHGHRRLGVGARSSAKFCKTLTRLQKHKLGRRAFETQMPNPFREALKNEDESNKLSGVIPKLAQLLEHEDRTASVYLCTDAAVQVYKVPKEGGTFCGYRNIQMMLLSLRSRMSASTGSLNIFEIQDIIEQAWAHERNVHGREQTGGIRISRKQIGMFEAEALLSYLGIDCTVRGYYGKRAPKDLLDFVALYFSSSNDPSTDTKSKLRQTRKPPLYLQRPGHSFTIVGIEVSTDHQRRLLAFDPAWAPPTAMRAVSPLSDSTAASFLSRKWILQQYRKPYRYLRRFGAFETISIG